MHNGVVSNFSDIRRKLSDLVAFDPYCNIYGSTDSEHAAALYITYLTRGSNKDAWEDEYTLSEMQDALIRTIVQIMKLQYEILGPLARPNSLNFCVTDGKKMVATRFRNHRSQQPPSLYWSEFAGRTLNTKFEGHPDGPQKTNRQASFGPETKFGRHTIISSEPTTFDENEWHLINKNCALTVDEFGTEIEVPIIYDEALNAKDPVKSK